MSIRDHCRGELGLRRTWIIRFFTIYVCACKLCVCYKCVVLRRNIKNLNYVSTLWAFVQGNVRSFSPSYTLYSRMLQCEGIYLFQELHMFPGSALDNSWVNAQNAHTFLSSSPSEPITRIIRYFVTNTHAEREKKSTYLPFFSADEFTERRNSNSVIIQLLRLCFF